jgi:hypothetical protein
MTSSILFYEGGNYEVVKNTLYPYDPGPADVLFIFHHKEGISVKIV